MWARAADAGEGDQVPLVFLLDPFGKSLKHSGRAWRLGRVSDSELLLRGTPITDGRKAIRPGDMLNVADFGLAGALDGRMVDFSAPEAGCLLLYSWAPGFSACQRDALFTFEKISEIRRPRAEGNRPRPKIQERHGPTPRASVGDQINGGEKNAICRAEPGVDVVWM